MLYITGLGTRIRKRREEMGLTPQEFADRCSFPVDEILAAERDDPSCGLSACIGTATDPFNITLDVEPPANDDRSIDRDCDTWGYHDWLSDVEQLRREQEHEALCETAAAYVP